jgi:hypothetical protein
MRRTNPIWPLGSGCPRVNAQNEANLAWPQTRAGGEMRKTNPIPGASGGTWPQGRGTPGKCAKRTQFRPAAGG